MKKNSNVNFEIDDLIIFLANLYRNFAIYPSIPTISLDLHFKSVTTSYTITREQNSSSQTTFFSKAGSMAAKGLTVDSEKDKGSGNAWAPPHKKPTSVSGKKDRSPCASGSSQQQPDLVRGKGPGLSKQQARLFLAASRGELEKATEVESPTKKKQRRDNESNSSTDQQHKKTKSKEKKTSSKEDGPAHSQKKQHREVEKKKKEKNKRNEKKKKNKTKKKKSRSQSTSSEDSSSSDGSDSSNFSYSSDSSESQDGISISEEGGNHQDEDKENQPAEAPRKRGRRCHVATCIPCKKVNCGLCTYCLHPKMKKRCKERDVYLLLATI